MKCCYCELNVIVMTITVGLVSTLGILTALPAQVVFAVPLIGSLALTQSNRDNTGYMVCDPNCHIAANSDRDNGSNDSTARIQVYCQCALSSIWYLNGWYIHNNRKWTYRPSERTYYR